MPPTDGNWSYEDLTTLAKGLTKAEGGRTTAYGVLTPIFNKSANEGIVGFLRAFGGDLFDADGKKCLLNTPESKAGLRALASLYESGSAVPWAADIEEQRMELFFGQRVGMIIQTAFAASAWPDQIAKLPQPFEMEVVPNPLGPTGKHATQVSSDGKGISQASKNPDKAWISSRSCSPASGTASSDSPTASVAPAAASTFGTATSFDRRRPSSRTSPRRWSCRRPRR